MRHVTLTSSTLLRTARIMLALAAALIAPGCSSGTEPGTGGPPAALAALPRPLSTTEVRVRDAANEFSFALLRTVTVAQPNENTFISPLSASFALGMTMNGAAGQSYADMKSALQLNGLTEAEANGGYKSLTALLLSLDPGVQTKIANSIWYRSSFAFHQAFFDTTTRYFGATVKPLNFDDVSGSLSTINGWVRTATSDRIQKVLDDIDPRDVMFLMNAIYFKGSWRDQFDPALTTSAVFTPLTGAPQLASTMHRMAEMAYTETSEYQAVDLPYGNTAFSMTVVLPKAGRDVNALATGLSPTAWQALRSSLHGATVNLAFPKLALAYERRLTDDLKALGMRAPFSGAEADFSRMTPAEVFISFVKQNSFVDINEEGTEAAAVTTVGVRVVSAPLSVTMRVDRPYLFVIHERLSGTILFMGRIVRMPA